MSNEPTPQEQAENIRRLVVDEGLTNVEALNFINAQARARQVAAKFNESRQRGGVPQPPKETPK